MSYSVLIVDDSSVTRHVVRKTLGMIGLPVAAVYEAGNGHEALAVLVAKKVDVVLLDLQMPEMNGVEVIERMAGDDEMRDVPVIVVSGNRAHPALGDLERLGIRGYLAKPFRPEDLRTVLQRVLPAYGAM